MRSCILQDRNSIMVASNPFITSLLIAIAIQVVFFVFAFKFKTDKVTDLSYGLTFIVIALYWLYNDKWIVSRFRLIVTLMVVVWAVRLIGYLFIRVLKTKKDSRYDERRNSFRKFAKFWILQAIAVWLIMLPVVYMLTRSRVPKINMLPTVGLYIWSFGLLIETIADRQLYVFRFKKNNGGRWIDEGLWHYSRHPNYFGEIMVWIGVFVFGLSTYSGAGWLVVLGPLTIIGLLMFGSGIPILEKANDKKWGTDPEYQRYKASTSILVPLPPKKVAQFKA